MKKIDALSLPRHLVEFMGLLLFSSLACFTSVHGAETRPGAGASYALAKGRMSSAFGPGDHRIPPELSARLRTESSSYLRSAMGEFWRHGSRSR